ncbi:MAG: MFS transporter [Pseudomonadota bacterium]
MITNDSPFAIPAFRRLFLAQVVALVGSGLATVALALLAYDLAGGSAGLLLGQVLAIKMLAYVLVAPVIGGNAYRFSRKQVLVVLDLTRALCVIGIFFVDAVWQVLVLVFLLSAVSAGFKPVFQATIPDIVTDEASYTRALAYSRVAFDLESLVSPAFAGLALLFIAFDLLFVANGIAFLVSAILILVTQLPRAQRLGTEDGVWADALFGVKAYLRTPRLRGLLCFYLGVAALSAMVVVNTVVIVRDQMQLGEEAVAMALAAAGAGSMIVALLVPRILNRISERTLIAAGGLLAAPAMYSLSLGGDFVTLIAAWFVVGAGLSLVQTPTGRVVNRSAAPEDRPAYFAAQFSLSHACWMVLYPIVGVLGVVVGISATAMIISAVVVSTTVVGLLLWRANDPVELLHTHTTMEHAHPHVHDDHHEHAHRKGAGTTHSHEHRHEVVMHEHAFVIDRHHPQWPD